MYQEEIDDPNILIDEHGKRQYVDERGHVSNLPGRRAARRQLETTIKETQEAINVAYMKSKIQSLEATKKQESRTRPKSVKQVASFKRTLGHAIVCMRCARFGHVEKDCIATTCVKHVPIVDNVKSVGSTDGINWVKESQLEQLVFNTKGSELSLGWAVCVGDLVSSANCTAFMNGVLVSAHLFTEAHGTVATLYFPHQDITMVVDVKNGTLVANDTLYFHNKQQDAFPLVYMRGAQCTPHQQVMLQAYSSAEDAKAKHHIVSTGIVSNIIDLVGHERAYVNYSSAKGHCAGEVMDQYGRLVGLHNAAVNNANLFIPITKQVVDNISKSQQKK
jgi:hypothetical protein